MTDTNKLEQQFLDGTHPALHRAGSRSAVQLGHSDPHEKSDTSDHDDDDDDDDDEAGEGPSRFSTVDTDPPAATDSRPPPLRETTNAHSHSRRRGEESRNTGVKGVRADYAEAMMQQQQDQEQDLARRVERGLNLGGGSAAGPTDSAREEQAELDRLRQRRLAQLQGSGERDEAGRTRTFGHLSEVGIEGFVAAVEDEDPETAVVVHLYEPDISTCAILNSHLASLARSHPRTKFLRAQASEVDFMQQQPTAAPSFGSDSATENAGDATLPTVLVYRAGELETVWVRFDFECPGGKIERGPKGLEAVEEVLSSAGVVVASRSSMRNGAGPRRIADDSDDDDD